MLDIVSLPSVQFPYASFILDTLLIAAPTYPVCSGEERWTFDHLSKLYSRYASNRVS